jgi:hypothetical protein
VLVTLHGHGRDRVAHTTTTMKVLDIGLGLLSDVVQAAQHAPPRRDQGPLLLGHEQPFGLDREAEVAGL